jgi:hypothetical protein
MNQSQKFMLGILIIFGILIAYALLADAAKDKGGWVWLVVAVVVIGLMLPAIKSDGYRRALKNLSLGSLSALGSIMEANKGNSGGESTLDRRPIPRALRQKILSTANNRCRFPGCQVRGRKNLHVHHIDMDPEKEPHEPDLIAFCPEHHQAAHHDQNVTIRQVRAWARGSYSARSNPRPRNTRTR